MYADDICLISPSAKGTQILIDVCTYYGGIHDIIFNSKKTNCMCIFPNHGKICKIPPVYLNGVKLDVVSKKKYLGFVLSGRFRDDDDIERQMRYFYISANMLMRNFFKCTFHVKCVLFKAYCYQLYGGPLWSNYSLAVMRKLKVAYNNAARLLLGYDKRSSASTMFVTNNISN